MLIDINPKKHYENAKRFISSMDWPEAIVALNKSLQMQFHENTLAYLMYCHLQRGDYRRLERLIRQYRPRQGFALYTLYWYYFLKGDLDEIPDILENMLSSDHYFLRCFALKQKNARGYIVDPEASIRQHLHFTGLSYDIQLEEYRSSIYLDQLQGHFHLALAQMRLSLQDYPDFVELHMDLVDLVVAMGKESLMREVLNDDVLKRYAEKDYRLMWSVARAWYKLKEFDQSWKYLSRLKKKFPANPLYYHHIGNIMAQQGQVVNAIRAYKEAISLAPLFEKAWYNLGTVYTRHGYLSDATRCLEEAIRIKKHLRSLQNLSYCLIESKRLEEAYVYLDQLPFIPGRFRTEIKDIKNRIREAVVSI